ncbi:MAG: hypothetical protein IJC11_04615 [Alphaproteobacteria bacterium]|nr:hypothetical protein [Alphaproteobacteria bacterium]
MITQSLIITLLGMGGVFFFLFLLICFMNLLHLCIPKSKTNLNKVAAVIAVALNRKGE